MNLTVEEKTTSEKEDAKYCWPGKSGSFSLMN